MEKKMPTQLTSENVETIFMDCLFKDDEEVVNPQLVQGIMSQFGFHPDRLESHKADIKELLKELPDAFQANTGGGWSFLNACMTKHGDQWGEHRNIEQLMALGIASGQAKLNFPREMWDILPGGMPYFNVVE